MAIHLPPTVTLEVVEADPVVKGQTASSSYKPAKLSNGVKTDGAAVHRGRRAHRRPHRGRQLRGAREGLMAFRLSPHLTVMANAAQKAAKRLLRDFAEVEQLQVSVKGPSDFVSQADLRAEQTLKEELTKARPGYAFLMEESGASGSENWTWRWVVDPLDGTTNFLHGMPHWAISIGLERRLPDGTSEIARRPDLRPGRRRDVLGRERRRRLRQRTPAARLRSARDDRGGVRHRHPVRRRLRPARNAPSAARWRR